MDFKDVPRVAQDFMNRDHEEATHLANQIQDLISQAESGEGNISEELAQEISKALEALLLHNREHFGREEEQMQMFNFPPYPIHKGEHERVLAEMEAELTAWQANQDLPRLKQYMELTLPAWFIGHIETMDTMTAIFITRSGG